MNKPFNLSEFKSGRNATRRDGIEAKFVAHLPDVQDGLLVYLT